MFSDVLSFERAHRVSSDRTPRVENQVKFSLVDSHALALGKVRYYNLDVAAGLQTRKGQNPLFLKEG
jgi:hypothetical protein